MSVSNSAWDLVMSGPLVLAAPVAVAAGALSFFSPCCLPLLPGYLSFVTGSLGAGVVRSGPLGRSRSTLVGAALFVLGFAAVFTLSLIHI